MELYKYTFLLPAYKARYFAEALQGIKSQTYNDFKVIVSDDCSSEDLKSIYDSVCGDDPRFSYRRNKENIGGKSLASHWNLLVDMCETEYLIMASDDDVYEPCFLEEIDALTKKYPGVDVFRAKSKRTHFGEISCVEFNLDEYLTYAQHLATFKRPEKIECLANYVFRTSRLREIGKFPDFPTASYSDAAVAQLMSKNGIAITKDVLFTFRISNLNITSPVGYSKNHENLVIAGLMFIDWYKENIGKTLSEDINEDEIYLLPIIYNTHKDLAESVPMFQMPHLSFRKCMHYFHEYRKRGYLLDRSKFFTLMKDYITYGHGL